MRICSQVYKPISHLLKADFLFFFKYPPKIQNYVALFILFGKHFFLLVFWLTITFFVLPNSLWFGQWKKCWHGQNSHQIFTLYLPQKSLEMRANDKRAVFTIIMFNQNETWRKKIQQKHWNWIVDCLTNTWDLNEHTKVNFKANLVG